MAEQATPWACRKCGSIMYQELAEAARQQLPPGARAQLLHVCGRCKTPHLNDDAGGLRLLTTAEQFDIQMKHGRALDFIDRTRFEPCKPGEPTATLLLTKGEPDADEVEFDFNAAINRLTQRHGNAMVSLSFGDLVGLIGQIQLALRHPANTGAVAWSMRHLVEGIIRDLAGDEPRLAELLRRGFDARHDVAAPQEKGPMTR